MGNVGTKDSHGELMGEHDSLSTCALWVCPWHIDRGRADALPVPFRHAVGVSKGWSSARREMSPSLRVGFWVGLDRGVRAAGPSAASS